jgi:hypothetical protein
MDDATQQRVITLVAAGIAYLISLHHTRLGARAPAVQVLGETPLPTPQAAS